MSAHPNEITFTVSDDGTVIIQKNGDVIEPDDFALMVKDAREKHAKLYQHGHTHYRFDLCPSCAKWSKASRMYDAIRSDKAR